MALKYPLLLIAIIIAVIAAFLVFRNRASRVKQEYSGGNRAANTDRAKTLSLYVSAMSKRAFATGAICILTAFAIIASSTLASRPLEEKSVYKSNIRSTKDIMLCLDISTSLDDQNREIIKTMRDLLRELDGERVGVVVFNTDAIVAVPLTDDYDFVDEKLEDIDKSIQYLSSRHWNYISPNSETLSYYYATTIHSETMGSSLIGDGLGTALYSFPGIGADEDDTRTRVIVLSTDNDQITGKEPPVMSLPEAADACAENGVKVMSLFPDDLTNIGEVSGNTKARVKKELKESTEKTGGTMYEIGKFGSDPSSDIANAINDLDVADNPTGAESITFQKDRPETLFLTVLALSIVIVALKARWRA